MDGWSVLGALKADPDLAAVPVVMVTFVGERGLATSLGANDFVSKPIDWVRLQQVMDRFREGDVLFVDDDADARRRLRTVVEKNGYARDGSRKWTRSARGSRTERPRLILLDLTMPVMDGFAFLHALRELPGCIDVPAVVLTARDLTNEDRKRLNGADQVLEKGQTSLRDLAEGLRSLALPANPVASGNVPS